MGATHQMKISLSLLNFVPNYECRHHYYASVYCDYAGHSKVIMSIAWEPAHMELPCRRFVTASQDGTAKVWDANTRHCLFTLSGHTRPVTCVKWGGDGFIHTSSRDGSIMVWDAKVCVIPWQSTFGQSVLESFGVF